MLKQHARALVPASLLTPLPHAQECHNDTRVCSHYVSEACLARKLADACVDDLIDEQSGAGQAEASGGGGGSSGSVSTSARAGIIAVVVVTCEWRAASRAASAAVRLPCHAASRRWRSNAPASPCCRRAGTAGGMPGAAVHAQAPPAEAQQAAAAAVWQRRHGQPRRGQGVSAGPSDVLRHVLHLDTLSTAAHHARLTPASTNPPCTAAMPCRAPTPTRLGAVKPGWQLHSSLISPLLGPVEDDAIQFGELLGSGRCGVCAAQLHASRCSRTTAAAPVWCAAADSSAMPAAAAARRLAPLHSFGRVFAGRWAGRDVAIKVIEHDTESIPAVESEIKLMFSFNHPHIVRLFKSVTYVSPAAKACSDTVSVTAHGSSNSRLARVPSQEAAALAAPAPAMVVAVAGGATPPGASAAASVDQQAAASTAAAAAGWTTSGSAYGDDNRPASKGQHKYSGSSSAAATDGRRRAETMLVMEFADQGTLCSYMAKLNGHAPMRPGDDAAVLQLLLLLHDAAAGLRMLHAANVIHGDLVRRERRSQQPATLARPGGRLLRCMLHLQTQHRLACRHPTTCSSAAAQRPALVVATTAATTAATMTPEAPTALPAPACMRWLPTWGSVASWSSTRRTARPTRSARSTTWRPRCWAPAS